MKNLNKIVHLHLTQLIKNKGDLSQFKIAVGYSGGADSTVLLHILSQKSHFFGFKLNAVFFHHGNSPIAESDSDINHCEEFCKKLNIPLDIQNLNLDKSNKQSWESAGRNARLNHYYDSSYDLVFLGHHRDDQNETTMTHLFRGAGKTVAGMNEFEEIYCRPFLKVDKNDIYDYLKYHNLNWIEDAANTDESYTRIFWRNVGLPTIAQHYPQYSNILDNVRDKFSSQHELLKDLAIVDGLNDLTSNKSVDISKLTLNRISNLIIFSVAHLGNSVESLFLKESLTHYENKKSVSIVIKEHKFTLNNGTISYEKVPLQNKKKIN